MPAATITFVIASGTSQLTVGFSQPLISVLAGASPLSAGVANSFAVGANGTLVVNFATPTPVGTNWAWTDGVPVCNFAPGITTPEPQTGIVTANYPTCPWFTYTQFTKRFGLKNVAMASNKENSNSDPDLDAVQDSFNEAVEAVQDEMRGGPYKVPFDFTPNGGVCPKTVAKWGMVVAYGILYIGGRGMQEKRVDPMGDRISKLCAMIYREMGFAKAGLMQLSLAVATTSQGHTVTQGGHAIHGRHRLWSRLGLDGAPTLIDPSTYGV